MATEPELLIAALRLLVIGMGMVYLMLGIMVLAIRLLSWLSRHSEVRVMEQMTPPSCGNPLTPGHVAAMAAAIHHHQQLASSDGGAAVRQEKRQ